MIAPPPIAVEQVAPAAIGPVEERAFDAAPGLPTIPSEFDVRKGLVPSWSNGPAPDNKGDSVGAFRFICGPGQLLYDDPVVHPGQPGKSHLHQFFGNLDADANSTYQSLRTRGKSTCNWSDFPLNRSAYWQPAMLDGHGHVVRPDVIKVYYKRDPISAASCAQNGSPRAVGICTSLPNGLKFVWGWNPVTHQGGDPKFVCDGPTAQGGVFRSIPEAAAACPFDSAPGAKQNQLGIAVDMPDCWDGKHLDSPDHRSHMGVPVDTHEGYFKCDAAHPFAVPTFSMSAWFTVDENTADWRLSSDAMEPDKPHGFTLHADWFGAWDNLAEKKWMDGCVNSHLNCSGGDLGDGDQLPGAQSGGDPQNGSGWLAKPRLVPVPAATGPSTMSH